MGGAPQTAFSMMRLNTLFKGSLGRKFDSVTEKGAIADGEKPPKEVEPPEPVPPRDPFKWYKGSWFKARRLFFLDVDALVHFGYKARLEPEDLYDEPTVNTKYLNSQFEPALEREMQKEKPDIKRALVAGNGKALILSGVLYGIAQACTLAGPILLQRIVSGLACQPYIDLPGSSCERKNKLYFYCIGLFLAPALQSLCENHQNYLLYMIGTRMRNTLMAAIYRKCLRLSNSAMQAESTGKIVTLMSNDAQKLQDAMFAIHAMWGSPCFIIAVIVLLWFEVGWATFVGLGVMLTLVPITGFLAAKLGGLRRCILKWTDKRVGLMSEVVNGIQMIKTYAWETSFTEDVMAARHEEAKILRITAFWQGIFGVLLFSGPVVVAIMCFGSYTIAGNELTAAKAYAALAYFSLLRFPMSFLPMLITMIVNALIAIKRIGGFLGRSESKMAEDGGEAKGSGQVEAGVVHIEGGEFLWDEEAEKLTLRDINIQALPGTLTMVVGSVGSGKSSILSALVGHINRRSGSVRLAGSVAYVAQSAWIMNDTVQENILMGADMDPERYMLALDVAQLKPDLEIFANGDLTEIGDRGITLSGGQKQRVSIARAVYYNADVVLLDDPLSAVDSHVGRALFEKCIRGPLRSKTVLLVTNALHYLPHADNIIWMDDGAIKGQGTYKQLVEQGLNIAELAHMDDDDADADDQETAGSKLAPPSTSTAAATPADAEAAKRKALASPSMLVDEKRKVVTSPSMLPKNKRRSLEVVCSPGKITLTRQAADKNRNLTGIEAREEGNLSMSVVKDYAMAGGGTFYLLLMLAFFGAEQAARVYVDRWIGVWFSNPYDRDNWFYLGIYLLLGFVYASCTFARSLNFLYTCVRAAVSLHNQLLTHVLRLPKSWFDTNPAGRVLNRFSRDVDIMDNTLCATLSQFLTCMASYIAILVVISIATVWFAIAIPVLTVIYIVVQRYYIPTARELQRIESVTRSPIYSKFGEALAGVTTIRAYRKEEHFTVVSDSLMEHNANAFITQKLAGAWLAMRLDFLGLLVLTGTGALCIAGDIDPGLAGLAIAYALDLTRYLKHGTNMASKSESDFNSVERIVQYLQPETEPAPDTSKELLDKMDPEWPAHGAITVVNLHMRYRPDMPLVLKGVSFVVKPGEKVGLVGRTGSGKSSLLLALLRMVPYESGTVFIDGVDVSAIGVRHLRSRMSVIPQDPFMFSGSVRHNLDPFQKFDDDQLWRVLDAVSLKSVITELELKLEAPVVDQGANFSLGQRQLFCMARAMLRNSRVLMLDEATASVDLDTDNLLQTAIRKAFTECTMLTIAHRLNTIMDSDRVIVMANGKAVENADPDTLLQADSGIFTGMVSQTGKSASRYLRGLASSAKIKRSDSLLAAGGGDSFTSATRLDGDLSVRVGSTTAGGYGHGLGSRLEAHRESMEVASGSHAVSASEQSKLEMEAAGTLTGGVQGDGVTDLGAGVGASEIVVELSTPSTSASASLAASGSGSHHESGGGGGGADDERRLSDDTRRQA